MTKYKEKLSIVQEIMRNELNIYEEISDKSIISHLGIDSIAMMALIVYLEEYCDTEIDIENLKGIDELTIKEFVLYAFNIEEDLKST